MEQKPVINVLNKIDKLDNLAEIHRLERAFNEAVSISALEKTGLENLVNAIITHLKEEMVIVTLDIPQHNMKAITFLHEHSHILKKEYQGQNLYIEAQISTHFKAILDKYMGTGTSNGV